MSKLGEAKVMCAEVLVSGGESVRSVARRLAVDESTLRYRLGRRRQRAEDGRRRQPERCATHAEVIAGWLALEAEGARPQAVRRLYEELVAEHGYQGSYKAVVRYVRRRRRAPALRPRRRVEVQPGSQAQVDWLERDVWLESLGGWARLYGFLLVLSFSRMWALVWSRRTDFLSWIACHNAALRSLGGVPGSLRIDNLKTGVRSGAGPSAELHAGYASYARQLGTVIDPARVRTPTDKGKVERRVRDVTGYLALGRERFLDLEHLQQVTEAKTLERAAHLPHPLLGGSVLEAWRQERGCLRPLPESLPQPFDVEVQRQVNDEALVHFEGREYHVPFRFLRREVAVRGCSGTVEIWSGGERIADYPRHTACRRLLRQDFYEGPGDNRVMAPTPLGALGQRLVLPSTWEVALRPIDRYAELLEARS